MRGASCRRGPAALGGPARLRRADDRAHPEAQAVACAEEFIARNGYTDAEPVDTARLAAESIQWGSMDEELAMRRRSLESRAAGVCVSPAGYTVVFRHAANPGHARGVTMTSRFGQLRVQHIDFVLANVPERRFGCRPAD